MWLEAVSSDLVELSTLILFVIPGTLCQNDGFPLICFPPIPYPFPSPTSTCQFIPELQQQTLCHTCHGTSCRIKSKQGFVLALHWSIGSHWLSKCLVKEWSVQSGYLDWPSRLIWSEMHHFCLFNMLITETVCVDLFSNNGKLLGWSHLLTLLMQLGQENWYAV